jgi:hypothetical protein
MKMMKLMQFNSDEIKGTLEEATVLMESGVVSKMRMEALLAILMFGRKLNIDSITAVTNIRINNGQLLLTADLMHALISQSDQLTDIIITNYDEECSVTIKRKDRTDSTATFTVKEAEQQECFSRPYWVSKKGDMLRERALAKCARLAFPEIIRGAVTPDEALDQAHLEKSLLTSMRTTQWNYSWRYWPAVVALALVFLSIAAFSVSHLAR